MTELSIAPIASVILALMLAVDGYNKAKVDPTSVDTANRFLTTIIALGLFLLVAIVAILFKPTTPGAKLFFNLISLVLLVIALVVAWLNYVNNSGKKFAVETLVIALVASIPILTTLITKETLTVNLNL
jgi:heme O synthase-like polyprenyltransferase